MNQESTVNSALRDLKFKDIINDADSDETQFILEQVWTAGMEYQRDEDKKNRQGRNRRINYYSRDNLKLGTFKSIEEAGNELNIPRKTIYNTLSGKFRRLRNGHYFRYADDESIN
jgi:hypothetical protein